MTTAKATLKRTRSATPGGGRSKFRSRPSPSIPRSLVLGNIEGRVRPSSTTLSRAAGPFTAKKYMTFEYVNSPVTLGSSNFLSLAVMNNSLYDFDKSSGNYFGNKQPLYYDSLLSASGPYKAYKVISWRTTYEVVNTGNVTMRVWAIPPTSGSGEIDSVAECDNFPGVVAMTLTPTTGSKSIGKLTVTGHISDVYTATNDQNLVGGYGSDPTNGCWGGICCYYIDGTTAISGNVSIKHEMFAELTGVDALVS